MAPILLASLAVLREFWAPTLTLLLTSFGLGLILSRALPGIRDRVQLRAPFAATAGLAALAPLCFALVLLGRLWFPLLRIGGALVAIAALAALIREAVIACRNRKVARASPDADPPFVSLRASSQVFLFLAFLALLLLRLAFLKDLLFPPYSDSAEHALILQDFLTPGGTGLAAHGLSNLLRLYYHVGAHSIAAWLSTLTGSDPALTLTLLSQLSLALAPLSVFALASHLTADGRPAWLAALLAAAGWSMPAFAANWGKVPALAALAALPAVALGWIVLLRPAGAVRKNLPGWVAMLFLTGGLVFLHSRALIALILAVAGAALSRLLPRRADRLSWPASIAFAAALALLVLFPSQYQTRAYLDRWIIPTIGILLAAPFGFMRHPRSMTAVFFAMTGMLVAAILPFPEVSSGYGVKWLDQPFLDIYFHLPLALMGALGLDGLFSLFTAAWPKLALTILLSLGLLWNAAKAPVYPDPCCVLVRSSDLAAMNWLKENAPREEGVLVAAMPVYNTLKPIDAGAWIPALTGLPIRTWPYDFDWSAPSARQEACGAGSQLVYAGSTEHVFNRAQLEYLDWATAAFRDNRVTIYSLACP